MTGNDARLVIITDPSTLPDYATHSWLAGRVEIPTRIGWADVTLTHDDDGEIWITFTPAAPGHAPCRLPYGRGVERVEATDPDNAQALAQYAHTLAAQGKARITPNTGTGTGEAHEGGHPDTDRPTRRRNRPRRTRDGRNGMTSKSK